MNRRLYYFGIFILSLTIVAGLLQNVLYWQLGGSVVMLESFMSWYIANTVTSLLGTFIILKYFHFRTFHFAFVSFILSSIINLGQSVVFYFIISGAHELQGYYGLIIYLVLGAAILHAMSLVFSSAREKRWLKMAGIVTLIIASAFLAILLASVNSRGAIQISLGKLAKAVECFGVFIPFLLILNFLDEIRMLKRKRSTFVIPEYMESVIGLTAMVLFAFTLTLGLTLWSEASQKEYWQTKNAEETDKFVKQCEQRSFKNSKGETLNYLLLRPKDYNPSIKYPLVVSLPYGNYESPPAQWLARDANRYRYPSFIFVPYCPEGAGWGGIPNYPTIDTLVFDAILKLEEGVSIDKNRRYVAGVSRGGYGSWHFITTRPDMFAAAIPVCGGGDTQHAGDITKVSIWAFHGAHDRNVPVSNSRDMIEAIKKAGGNPKYTEFPDKAHDIWYEITQMPSVLEWLFAQKRISVKSNNEEGLKR